MDYITELKNIRNNLKLSNNYATIKYTDFENVYVLLSNDKDNLEDELADINNEQIELLKSILVSILGGVVSIIQNISIKDNNNFLLIFFIATFIISTIQYLKGIRKFALTNTMYEDINSSISEIVLKSHLEQRKKNQINNYINKIDEIIDLKDDSKAKEFINLLNKDGNYLDLSANKSLEYKK